MKRESDAVLDAVNIAAHLPAMARRYPDKPAVVLAGGGEVPARGQIMAHGEVGARGGTSIGSRGLGAGRGIRELTFRELDEETDRYAYGLERIGITRGVRTILMVRPGLEFFAITFALFKIGAIPVLIDPGMGRRSMIDCLAEVEAEAFIGIPLAHAARTIYRKAFRSVRVAVTVGRRWFWGGHRLRDVRTEPWKPYPPAETRPDEMAAVLFTSGSTGPAKGVVYEHGMFDAQVRYLQGKYGYGPEEVDLATFPLFALFDAALGMTAVIPDMDASRPAEADPEKIIGAIRANGVTHMFGSPALLDRVSRHALAHGITLPNLKRIMTAGAPVPYAVLDRVRRMLSEDAEVHTPYGATESLPVASIESREILGETSARTAAGEGICVGRPLDGMSVRIIGITDEPIAEWDEGLVLPAGQIGEICVRGPVVTKEYFRKARATSLAKIRDGESLYHRMGDVGYLDENGRLWFCGRKAHRVRTEAGLLFTIPCEAIFNQHPAVRRSALVGVPADGGKASANPSTPRRPVICIELEKEHGNCDRGKLVEELKALAETNPLTRGIDTFLFHPAFPVDVRHNAKIFREKLAVWAAERLA